MVEAIRTIRRIILDAVFPIECFSCGVYGAWWCADCQNAVPLLSSQSCLGCGTPSVRGETCYSCFKRDMPLDGFIAATPYHQQQVQKAIGYLKYHGVKDLATPLGDFIAQIFHGSSITDQWWYAMPVPLFLRRERMRGFNQSYCIADAFSCQTGIALLPGLTRIQATHPQMQLSREDRRKNMQADVFRVVNPDTIAGKRILLIDDVATTGSTMAACARVLKQAGAVSVWGIAVAHG